MAVCGINHDGIYASAHQRFNALFGALAHAHRSAHAQLALRIACREWKAGLLGDVLDGHEAAQLASVVDHQHALELVLVHERLAVFKRGAFIHRHQTLARRHDFAHRRIQACLETQIAVGHDAHDARAFQHRKTRHAVLT